jgi:hypothetical protein
MLARMTEYMPVFELDDEVFSLALVATGEDPRVEAGKVHLPGDE